MAQVEQLIAALTRGPVADRAAAAEALARLERASHPAMVALVGNAGSADEGVREWASAALEAVGPPAALQIADLVRLSKAADEQIAYWALTLLGRAGAMAATAVAAIADRLKNSPPGVQQRAAWALGEIGRLDAASRAALEAAAASSGPLAFHAQAALARAGKAA